MVSARSQCCGIVSILSNADDERPFFTAGHIFHTTTGPRAVDPRLAMMDNPWDLPGHLLEGHSIYQWSPETKQYATVQIKSITSEVREDVHEVWDVHFRGGQRSYHANGFLVAVNYPEVQGI